MTKSKSKPRFIMTRCNECNHIWKKPVYANRKCPKCGSTNISDVEDRHKVPAEPEPEEPVEAELEDEGQEEEGHPVSKPEKAKAKVAKAAKGMSMSMAIPPKSDYVKSEELSAQEQMMGEILAGVGIKQPTALAKILGRGPTDSPQWMDKILNRHGIPYQQRLLVHDILFPDDMESEKGPEGKGDDKNDMRFAMREMFDDMRSMWFMKMMKDMMGGDGSHGTSVPLPAQQQPPEQLVTMIDEKGLPLMDPSTGQPVKVPASMFMMYKMRQSSSETSTVQEMFLEFQKSQLQQMVEFYKSSAGGGGAKEIELLAGKMTAETNAKLQELNAQRMKEISESRSQSMSEITTLRSELKTKEMLEEQDRRFAQHAADLRKQLEDKERELDKVKDSRQGDALSVQTELQRKTGDVVTDAFKGMTEEMREGRREVRGIFTEQLKQQQLVDRANTQRQAVTTSVTEVPLDQVGQEIEGMEQQAGMAPPPPPPAPVQGRRSRRDTLDLSILVGEG